MNKGIAIAGNLIVDYVKIIDKYPAAGMLCNILERSQSVGGCAVNTLGCVAAMDPSVPLYCAGRVGKDEAGDLIVDFLKNNNICIDGVLQLCDDMTSFTDVMTVKDTGDRTFFHARGANGKFCYEDIKFEEISKYDIFHIGYALLLDMFDSPDAEYGTVMAKTLAKARSMGVKTSMDVVSEDGERFEKIVRPCLKYCSYFIANELEGGRVVGIEPRNSDGELDLDNLKKICEALLRYGVKELVVLHAPEGGAYMTKNGDSGFVGSLKLPKGYIKGSVGAGDAFCAGILYSLYKGFPVEKAMALANAAAAASLSAADSLSGLRPIEEVFELAERYR